LEPKELRISGTKVCYIEMTNTYLDKLAAEIRRTADPDAALTDEDLPLY
jgi:hypothetical protein